MITINRSCPKCSIEIKQDGRCKNTKCEAYSYKVLEEAYQNGELACQGFSGPCDSMKAGRYAQNTRYVNDELNFMVLCDRCQEESNEYWAEMWSDYWSGCL